MAENRRIIIDAAGRLFRERGIAGVSVADVMKAAGMTHGGFYRHFADKDELVAHALAGAIASVQADKTDLDRFATSYLSPAHRGDVSHGCLFAALGPDIARAPSVVRRMVSEGLAAQIDQFTDLAGSPSRDARTEAIGTFSALVGAVILSRISDDPALSDEILAATRSWLAKPDRPAQPLTD